MRLHRAWATFPIKCGGGGGESSPPTLPGLPQGQEGAERPRPCGKRCWKKAREVKGATCSSFKIFQCPGTAQASTGQLLSPVPPIGLPQVPGTPSACFPCPQSLNVRATVGGGFISLLLETDKVRMLVCGRRGSERATSPGGDALVRLQGGFEEEFRRSAVWNRGAVEFHQHPGVCKAPSRRGDPGEGAGPAASPLGRGAGGTSGKTAAPQSSAWRRSGRAPGGRGKPRAVSRGWGGGRCKATYLPLHPTPPGSAKKGKKEKKKKT